MKMKILKAVSEVSDKKVYIYKKLLRRFENV